MDSTQLSITESTRSEQEDEDEDEDEDEEKLEEEVKEMVNKVKKYRSTLPLQLTSSLSSLLSSQRPSISLSSDVSLSSTSHLMPGGESCSESPNRELTAGDGDRAADDIKLLKEKILTNISAMPNVLKRMNDCISKLDRLVSSNETIHPAFKRKKS